MQSHIRNFCIIAHIDHGKSTLADRLLEMTGTVQMRDMQEQLLDSNPIERERGITIQLTPVRMIYKKLEIGSEKLDVEVGDGKLESKNQKIPSQNLVSHFSHPTSSSKYILNLIDTPGHVDFTYEVSRSLAACEGAVLVVDATQGVQAQTLANLNLARKQKLTIIPVINKVDLPNAEVEEVATQLVALGFKRNEIMQISAKTGLGVPELLKTIVERVPAPQGDSEKPLRALIFSSQYDTHKGVVVYVRVVDGNLTYKPGTRIRFIASHSEVEPIELGYFIPKMHIDAVLHTGEVGYIATGLKDVSQAKVGDTITLVPAEGEAVPDVELLPGYHEPKPMVFLGLFPINSDEYAQVREALGKLRLSDSAFTYRPISSPALGNGFHCGFLGLLHAEIVQERLSREFNLALFATAPSVEYAVKLKNVKTQLKIEADGYAHIQSAIEYPDPSFIEETKEPMMNLTIFAPKRFVGDVMQLAQEKRGEFIDLHYIGADVQGESETVLTKFSYLMPLSEMIVDFFDTLKSVTQGYASLDYEFFDYQTVDVVKLDILINHEKVDAFSQLVTRARAPFLGRRMVEKLAEVIPRRQFLIPIQAAIGGEIIARADVKPYRKDVLQKLYGGDRTRKDKLLKKQKKGKAKMKMVGAVEIPQEAFLKVFNRS